MDKGKDIQQRLFEHTKASIECHGWAAKALEAEAAGDKKKAAAYRKKAEKCMARMIKLEGSRSAT